MATGQRLTDPVLSGSPNLKHPHAPLSILNPKSQLAPSPPLPKKIISTLLASSVQPPSSEPGRGFALTTSGGGYCDATSPARLLPLRITPNSDVYVCLILTQGKLHWSYHMPLIFWYYAQLWCLPLFDTNTGQSTNEVIICLLPFGITPYSNVYPFLIPTLGKTQLKLLCTSYLSVSRPTLL